MNALKTVSQEIGTKLDSVKPMVSLIEPGWLLEVAHVLTFGARKYSKDNWKYVENAKDRYLSAAYRHLLAYQNGEVIDGESKLSHLAHASCCLMFLHFLEKNKMINKTQVCNDNNSKNYM